MSAEEHKRQEGARTKAATAGKAKDEGVKIGGEWAFKKKPQFLDDRLNYWNELFDKQKKLYEGK